MERAFSRVERPSPAAVPAFTAVQASLDPTVGRLAAFAYVESSPPQLLVAFHHLAVDGVSIQILLEDLRALLLQLKAGEEPALGVKTASVREVAQALELRAQTVGVLDQLDFWALNTSLPIPHVPLRSDAAARDCVTDEVCISVRLSAAETDRLLRGPAAEGLNSEDILIAALTLALGDWTGESVLYVQMEGHGRDAVDSELDIARTVGWLTSHYPVWFDLTSIPIEEAPKAIHAQRLEIPDRGTGFGLLRYLGSSETCAQLASGLRPEVSFNFLGQIAPPPPGAFSVLSWEPDRPCRGLERKPAAVRTCIIAIEAMISNNCLVADWKFNPARTHVGDVEKATDLFKKLIVDMTSKSMQTSGSISAKRGER